MAIAALSPVSVAVYGKLNVSGLTSLGTFYGDALPQNPTYPCVWYRVREEEARGLGGGSLPMVEIWVHCLSTYQGMKDAQALASKAKELLSDVALTVTGFTHAGLVFFDRITSPVDYEINGKVVRELTAQFYTWVEAS